MDSAFQNTLDKLIKDFYSNEICLLLDQMDYGEISIDYKYLKLIFCNVILIILKCLIKNNFYKYHKFTTNTQLPLL